MREREWGSENKERHILEDREQVRKRERDQQLNVVSSLLPTFPVF